MRYVKSLEPDRCPWCGGILPRWPKSLIDLEHIKHSLCGKWCRRYWMSFADVFVFGFIGVFVLLICWELNILFTIGKWFLLLWAFIFAYHYNVKRPWIRALPGEKWWKEPPAEPVIGKVDIRWYTMKEGGIGFPRIRITNDRIFVVCLVDKEGVPVSQTICVRLRRLFLGYWKATKVFLISDDLWKEDASGVSPWEKAEKMLIYNKREVIGEGVIRR